MCEQFTRGFFSVLTRAVLRSFADAHPGEVRYSVTLYMLCIYYACNRKAIQSTGSLGAMMHMSCSMVYAADAHPGSTINFTILVNLTLYRQAKEHCRQTTGSLGLTMYMSCYIVYADALPGSTINSTILHMQAKEQCRQTSGSLGPCIYTILCMSCICGIYTCTLYMYILVQIPTSLQIWHAPNSNNVRLFHTCGLERRSMNQRPPRSSVGDSRSQASVCLVTIAGTCHTLGLA